MSEDFLSQEEIDALLGDGYPPLDDDDSSFEEADAYTVAEAVRVCVANAFDEVNAGLKEPVGIDFIDVDLRGLRPTEGEESEWIATEIDLSGEINGILVLLAHPDWVQTILQGMESGEHEQTDELVRFGEFLHPFATALGKQLSTLLRFDLQAVANPPNRVDLAVSVAELPFGQSERVITFDLLTHAGDVGTFPGRLLMPNEVAEVFMERLTTMNGNGNGNGNGKGNGNGNGSKSTAEFVADEPKAPTSSESLSFEAPPPIASVQTDAADMPLPTRGEVRKAEFVSLDGTQAKPGSENIDLLLDVPLNITVELGRAEMEIREILSLTKGQVIELDKLAGEPVDVFVNGKLVAKGEVVVIDENFGVKISSIVSRQERMQNLR